MSAGHNGEHECESCVGRVSSRRDFLLVTAGAVGGLTLLLGFTRGEPHAGALLRYPIPAANGAVIDRDNELIIVRQQARAYAFALSCPHKRTMLKWRAEDSLFQCPKHKSRYQPDGTFISGRATRGMDRHAIRLQGRELIVDPTVVYREDENPAGWKGAFVTLR